MAFRHSGFMIVAWGLVVASGTPVDGADTPQFGKSPTRAVIAAMTREERSGSSMGTGMQLPFLPPEMQGPAVGQVTERVAGAAGTTFAIPRLGIPAIVVADGPRAFGSTPSARGTTRARITARRFRSQPSSPRASTWTSWSAWAARWGTRRGSTAST